MIPKPILEFSLILLLFFQYPIRDELFFLDLSKSPSLPAVPKSKNESRFDELSLSLLSVCIFSPGKQELIPQSPPCDAAAAAAADLTELPLAGTW